MTVATRLIDRLKIDNVRIQTAALATIVLVNEGVLIVNKTVGAVTAVTLKPSPEAGDFQFIKDGKGDAATNNITITAAAGNIDGAANYVISENYGSVLLMYNGTEWSVDSSHKENVAQAVATFTTANVTNLNVTGPTVLTGHATTTDGVASGTARVIGGTAFNAVVASSAVASTSVETLFDQSYSIPAGTLKAGTLVKIKFQGIATTTVGSDTLIIKAYIGGLSGTALVTSSTTDAVNNDIFAGEATLVVRTAGNSGTFVGSSSFTKVEGASGTASRVDFITASTAVNTNAAQVVGVSATWNTANANSCRLDILAVEIA
jgi:hypothetical protein